MIYLQDANILFLKPRKVAGTSLEIALSSLAGPNDIITSISPQDEALRQARGFRGPQNHRYRIGELSGRRLIKAALKRELPLKYYHHMPASGARDLLGAERFDKAHKISIVRNPYDFMVSMYFWRNRHRDDDLPEFENWIRENPQLININNLQYFIDGKPVIDSFLRYESLTEDLQTLARDLPVLTGIGDLMATLKTKTGIRPKRARAEDMFAKAPAIKSVIAELNRPLMRDLKLYSH